MAFKIDINLNYDQCLQQNKTKLLRDGVIIELVLVMKIVQKNYPESTPICLYH